MTELPNRSRLCQTGVVGFWYSLAVVLLLIPASLLSQGQFRESGTQLIQGSDGGFLLDTPTRKKIDLGGEWRYSVEGGASGIARVPSSYTDPASVSFERKFDLNAEDLAVYRFQLVCFGVNDQTEIFVNGEFVGSHAGGSTSFIEDLPDNLLLTGPENTIRVVTSNKLDMKRTFPLRRRVWGGKSYGGIVREVFLLATPRLFIKDALVRSDILKSGAAAVLTVSATVDGPDPSADTVRGIPSGAAAIVAEVVEKVSGQSVGRSALVPLKRVGDEWDTASVRVQISEPKLWRPESPDLYLVKISLVTEVKKEVTLVDEYDVTHGIASLVIDGADLRLNGKRIVLKGVTWYEDHPVWGCSLPPEQMERDVIMMKILGANCVRFAEHPPHPYMLNLCDRYGLLAMEELPVSAPADVLSDETYRETASGLVREMVRRDRNHVSVLAWGIGNEFDVTGRGPREYVRQMVEQIRVLDGRPTYYGGLLLPSDSCAQYVDLAAVNLYAASGKEFKAQAEQWHAQHKDRPIIISRFGTEVDEQNQNGYSDPLSQQNQARFYLQRLQTIRSLDYDGAIIWSFNDWTADRPALTVHSTDPTLCSMGLVSAAREKRIAYDAVRSVFEGERFSALPQGSYSTGAPIVYVLTGFILLVVLAYLYNANRRFRESLNRSLLNSYNFFADVRDQHAVPLLHSGFLGLIVSFAVTVVVSSFLLHFRDDRLLDDLLSLLLVRDDLKVVLVHLVRNPLRFILIGGAAIFVGFVILGVLLLGLRLLIRTRLRFYHSFTVTIWSFSPLIVLIPIGMILFRVMESSVYVLPALVLCIVLVLWVLLRLLKGISIVFDIRRGKVFGFGLVMLLGVLGGLYAYYDVILGARGYFAFLLHTLSVGG